MCDTCDCNDFPILPPASESLQARDSVVVVGKGEIVVTPSNLPNGAKQYLVERSVYTPPQINATANPTREVGQLVDFTWNVNIQQGRQPIIRKQIFPGGEDPGFSFSRSVTDSTRSTRGTNQHFNIQVEDDTNNIVQRNLAIAFWNKVYRGYSYKDGVTAGQELTGSDIAGFTATLANGIKDVYGGFSSYVIPVSGAQQYIFWLYETGTTPINSVELSNLPFPLVFIPGSIGIVNPHDPDITTQYAIVRSANKFASQTLSLNMK